MNHLPALIQDLAIILMTAGIVTILFRKIGQPVVLGYIIAGLLVGPKIHLFPTVSDIPNIQIWAEMGVIFLLFALGLEFSFKKLAKVGGSASLTALIEVAGMTSLGFIAGKLFGWSTMDSLFLGGILAISSTTIIIRAFEEAGVKGQGFVGFVFGILIVEDLAAILLLVLLSTVAVTNQFNGHELLISAFKLVFFILLWFLSGIFLLPSLLKFIRKQASDEMLLIVSVGLCFVMVVLSTNAGFSPALGAFIMGSIFAETTQAEKIEHIIKPVKDLFAAIFFVSVGMLIDPKVLVTYAVPILILTVVTILGKFMTTLVGALISGKNLRHATQAGMSLAQIGEFSFIIATLGLTLKVTSDFLYPFAVGVSIITTFTTPFLIKKSDTVYHWIENSLPERLRVMLKNYSDSTEKVAVHQEWKKVLWYYVSRIVTNSVMIIGIFSVLSKALPPVLGSYIASPFWLNTIDLVITLICAGPFFWALVLKRSTRMDIVRLWLVAEYRTTLLALEVFRVFTAILLFGLLVQNFITLPIAAFVSLILASAFLLLFSRYLKTVYVWFEEHFLTNLAVRENSTELIGTSIPLAPWDARIFYLDIPAESKVAGRQLQDLKVRESFGITIALIERGKLFLTAPGREERLYPNDRVAIIGTPNEIKTFTEFIKTEVLQESGKIENYGLHQIEITANMPFAYKTIRDSGLREQVEAIVVGLERSGERILNPESMLRLEPADILWLAGDSQKIRNLVKDQSLKDNHE